MISVQEAKQIIAQFATLRKIDDVLLSEARGLVTAADVFASTNIPNFAQSSMDGYAFKFADRSAALQIIGEMAAGASEMLTISDGEAVRIFTGAPLPAGADTVVMQEKVTVDGTGLQIRDQHLTIGLNVRPRGAEAKQGQLAMAAGTLLTPAALGFLAGIGCTDVKIFRQPTVAIILTGNELQTPGAPLGFGQVYESNSVSLSSALRQGGVSDIKLFKSQDDRNCLEATIHNAFTTCDVLLLCGGVSVGDYDFVVDAAVACGIEQQFHKIRQKPGKPLFFGTKGQQLIFGLPGNPSSSLTCFYEYVLPAMEQIMHLENRVLKLYATVTHDYSKAKGLTHFLKGQYTKGNVTPLHAQESFKLQSYAQANCLIVLDDESDGVVAGNNVEVHLLPT